VEELQPIQYNIEIIEKKTKTRNTFPKQRPTSPMFVPSVALCEERSMAGWQFFHLISIPKASLGAQCLISSDRV
jgi:hypothetical protein